MNMTQNTIYNMKTETISDLDDHSAQTEIKTECGATIKIEAFGSTAHRRKIAQIVRAALEAYEEPINASFSYANNE